LAPDRTELGNRVAPATDDPTNSRGEHALLSRFLSKELDDPLRHVKSEILPQEHRPAGRRQYVKHTFRGLRTGGDLLVFTKFGVALPCHARRLESFLSRLDVGEFRVPTFFGTVELVPGHRKSILIVWEYVPNDRPTTDGTWRANRAETVRAAAALAAVTDAALRRPGHAARRRLLRPAAGRDGG
jgi:hypothetical protein